MEDDTYDKELLEKIEEGLAQCLNGETVTTEQAKKILAKWLPANDENEEL